MTFGIISENFPPVKATFCLKVGESLEDLVFTEMRKNPETERPSYQGEIGRPCPICKWPETIGRQARKTKSFTLGVLDQRKVLLSAVTSRDSAAINPSPIISTWWWWRRSAPLAGK